MLLHSREGSGEHRLVDANALVEEALNLAYHGARVEKQGFNINLERSFDPAAGEVDGETKVDAVWAYIFSRSRKNKPLK
jgi:hypothetical protein